MGSVFVQSAVILLREGLEALLVLAALAAYLIKADARDRLPRSTPALRSRSLRA